MLHPITETLYKIRTYDGTSRYVEASTLRELYHHIAKEYMMNGHHITGVCKIERNGNTPRVSVLKDKEFNLILAQYLNYAHAIKLFSHPNSAVSRVVDFDANSAQLSWHNREGVIFTSIIEPSKNAKKGYVVIDGKDVIVDDWMKERWCD